MSERNILTMVLAGGAGTRLRPLTLNRCKPAVPFGGNFRMIDFTLINCAASGLREAHVLTQYRPEALMRHFHRRWASLARQLDLVALPPGESGPYAGTADAVYKNLELLRVHEPEAVLVLSGDHLYRADYRPLIEEHLERNAGATVLTGDVPAAEASSFGVLEVSKDGRILGFIEKPLDPLPHAREGRCAINLGVYCFKPEFLAAQLRADAADDDSVHDFGRNILPAALGFGLVRTCPLPAVSVGESPYWRDIGTLQAYFEASLDLLRFPEGFPLADQRWPADSPIRKWVPMLEPAAAEIDGRRIEGRNIFSTPAPTCGARIGKGAQLRKVIVEGNLQVPPGVEVIPSTNGSSQEEVMVLIGGRSFPSPSAAPPVESSGASNSSIEEILSPDRRHAGH